MKDSNGHRTHDDFIAPAQRAFRRVARQLRAEHARLGLPLIFGDGEKLKLSYVDKKTNKNMKRERSHESSKTPAFAVRAERALRRAARGVRAQNRALGLPVIVWQNGKVVKKPA
jgi:hypothetical protein